MTESPGYLNQIEKNQDAAATQENNVEHMKSLLVRFFEFLDLTDELDSGNIFHPINIGSCRADKQQPLEDLLAEMKKASM